MKQIKELRQFHKITQGQLELKCGLTPGCCSQWERGFRNPPVEQVIKIADAFELPLDWFYGRTVVQGIVGNYERLTVDRKAMVDAFIAFLMEQS